MFSQSRQSTFTGTRPVSGGLFGIGKSKHAIAPVKKSKKNNKFYAAFAKAAYSAQNQRISDLYKLIGNEHKFAYDSSLSNDRIAVFVSDKRREVVVAFRGTDLRTVNRSIPDLISDLGIALSLSKLSPRLIEGNNLIKTIRKKYPGYKITITGHSLGGKVGLNVAAENGLEAHLYNIGSSPLDKFDDIMTKSICAGLTFLESCKKLRAINHYHVPGDPISESASRGVPFNVIMVDKKTNVDGRHGIDNFT